MTTTEMTSPVPRSSKSPLLSGPLITLYAVDFAAMTSFYLLLSVTPLYAGRAGASGAGAGMITGAMMLSAVAVELVSPRLINRFGYRRVLVAGLVALGLPALAVPATTDTAALVAVGLLRGAGLAVIVVSVAGLGATVIPAERRGEGMGLLGIMSTLPAVIALPLGVLGVERLGFVPVFAIGAAAALVGAALALLLPPTPASAGPAVGISVVLRSPELLRPAVLFATTAMAASVVATFLPIAVLGGVTAVVPAALLTQTVATTAARWWSGRLADRHGAGRLVGPAVILGAVGVALLAFTTQPVAVLLGAGVFGVGFGVAQTASLNVMLQQAPTSAYAAVSAVWNLAYDLGLGVGAVAFGLLATRTGYPAAFAMTAALLLAGVIVARITTTGERA